MILRKSGEITLVKHLIAVAPLVRIVEEHMKGEMVHDGCIQGKWKIL